MNALPIDLTLRIGGEVLKATAGAGTGSTAWLKDVRFMRGTAIPHAVSTLAWLLDEQGRGLGVWLVAQWLDDNRDGAFNISELAISIVVFNGNIDATPQGVVAGLFGATHKGSTIVPETAVSLDDGQGTAYRYGPGQPFCPTPARTAYATRSLQGLEQPVLDRLTEHVMGLNPYMPDKWGKNPNQSGSPRERPDEWEGTIAAHLLGPKKHHVCRGAARAWGEEQLRRSLVYCRRSSGEWFKAANYPNVWIGSTGGWRTGYHGKIVRTTTADPVPDSEHPGGLREESGYEEWCDPICWLAWNGLVEAVASRPECWGLVTARNQRIHGRALRLLVRKVRSDGVEARHDLVVAIRRLLAAMYSAGGFHNGKPYPSLRDPKFDDHVAPQWRDLDWYLDKMELDRTGLDIKTLTAAPDVRGALPRFEQTAIELGLKKDTFTYGPEGFMTLCARAVIVWWTWIWFEGLVEVLRIPELAKEWPMVWDMAHHAARCALFPGRKPGIGADGTVVTTTTQHDAYIPLIDEHRVTKVKTEHDGTTGWSTPRCAEVMELFPGTPVAALAEELGREVYMHCPDAVLGSKDDEVLCTHLAFVRHAGLRLP